MIEINDVSSKENEANKDNKNFLGSITSNIEFKYCSNPYMNNE